MTADEFAALKAECDRRNLNITQIVALANIMPMIGYIKKKYNNSTATQFELTYCGKTRREWNKVKRQRLTEWEKEQRRTVIK